MSKLLLPILLVVTAALIVLLQLGFIFLLVAMLPTVVAFYVDRDASRPTFKVVAACNFAATLPALAPMIKTSLHFRYNDVSSVMGDPSVWLIVYSGAAAGWCLVYLCRYIARFLITLIYEYNIHTLEHTQERLVEEWGQQIRTPPLT